MRRKLLLTVILLLLGASATAGYLYYNGRQVSANYLTARVERGRIATTVNATGTLNAVITVQVGSQVSGTIQKLFVDYNSPVTEGQIIAQIDPASFEARVSQARANVASAGAAVQVARANVDNSKAAIETAQANIGSAKANVERAKVGLTDARRTLERNKQLLSQALIAQSDLDVAQTAYDSAVSQLKQAESQQEAAMGQLKSATAQVRLAEAQHAAALAQVEQAKAALQAAELDLAHTTIRAPVNGIVVSRNVDVGQTVAASLQAPTLFLIAQDLTQMQVDTNVSEADIGRIGIGQAATFTVDAYPNAPFTGKVVQVRNAPIIVQNVVTYDAVVQVANPRDATQTGDDGQCVVSHRRAPWGAQDAQCRPALPTRGGESRDRRTGRPWDRERGSDAGHPAAVDAGALPEQRAAGASSGDFAEHPTADDATAGARTLGGGPAGACPRSASPDAGPDSQYPHGHATPAVRGFAEELRASA